MRFLGIIMFSQGLLFQNSCVLWPFLLFLQQKLKKSSFRWLPFSSSGYKEAKNNKLVVTIKKKYNYEKVNDDPDGSHDRHRSKCTVQHQLLQSVWWQYRFFDNTFELWRRLHHKLLQSVWR